MASALDRIQRAWQGEPKAQLFYIFVSEYARECVETVMKNKCRGQGFVTATRPDITKPLLLLKQACSPEEHAELRDNINEWWQYDNHKDEDLVKLSHLIQLADSIRSAAGLTYEAFAESVKVTLAMNEIRDAHILVEV